MKSSKELLALPDLGGWRIAEGYWAQLAHGLMGTFPALLCESLKSEGELFVCLDKSVLEEALQFLPRRNFKISKNLVVANETSELAFDLTALNDQRDIGRESEPIRLLTANGLLTKSDRRFFKWAPGLVSNDMSQAEFAETLQVALAQA